MRPGIDPKVDYAFKRLFGTEGNLPLLIHLLNAVLPFPAGRQVTGLELLNPFNEKERQDDKLSAVDVKARDQGGRQFHVEMQQQAPWFFPQRTLYYWARLHPQQMLEGNYFQTLRPTISVCFLDSVLFEGVPEHHLSFRLWAEQQQVTLTNDLAIHMLELPKFTLTAEELTNPCDVWCFFLRHGQDLDADALPPALNVPPIRQAMEVLKVLSQSDLERERYLSAHMAQLDRASLLEEVRRGQEAQRRADEAERRTQEIQRQIDEAQRQTQEETRRGREQGELIGRIHLCQRLLKQPLTPREELLALPMPELARLPEELERQLPGAS